jgi:hypothetical protein
MVSAAFYCCCWCPSRFLYYSVWYMVGWKPIGVVHAWSLQYHSSHQLYKETFKFQVSWIFILSYIYIFIKFFVT